MNTTTGFLYDDKTGELLGDVIVQKSPVSGEYMVPPCVTMELPPQPGEHEVAVWNGQGWDIKPDYRGNSYWSKEDKQQHEITIIGDEPLAEWTDKEPTDRECLWSDDEYGWVVPFDVLQTRKLASIRREADRRFDEIKNGYSSIEIDSWAKQEQGAKDLTADSASQTDDAVFVRNQAVERGMPVEQLVAKILAAVSSARTLSAGIIGIQQRLEDLVKAASTTEELEQITWPQA